MGGRGIGEWGVFEFSGCGTGSRGGGEEGEEGGRERRGRWERRVLYFLANSAWCFGRLLAPLWVVPEYQGCGVASLLLRKVIKLADRLEPPQPMYLEALPAARPIYEHFG